ncbi:MAG TPA: aldehyde dehydrogenase family protein [Dehalococcoidia bacterium]|nr:aldehyde dehydrogenase family protein [Dehalococcoidia bacterium]
MTTETAPAGPQAVTGKEYLLLINGQQVAPKSGEMLERRYPANSDVTVARFAKASEEDVDAAIQAARGAFDNGSWSKAPARNRASVLRRAADKIRSEQNDLARLLASEVGKPLSEAGIEVALTSDVFDYYAGLALDIKGQVVSNYVDDAIGLILKEPIGVIGIITPWNFPMLLATWKIAPALAVGCTVVVKPASYTPCTTYELGRILNESGAPAGVVNVVTGSGKTVGDRIASSHLVDKVAFTGSTEVGQQVMRAAAGNVKKISLELGGKSPNVIFADANMQGAVIGALFGIYMNAGQVCQAGSRLLVEESVHDQFLNMFSNFVAGVKVGDPMDPATRMGPVVSDAQLDTVESYVKAGNDEKATLVRGGKRLTGEGYDKGYFYEPTIFDQVDNRMKIAQEEIFGPVLSVIPFKDADEALRLANDTMYGLAAAVWTKDIDRAFKFAKGIKAGTVWINSYHAAGTLGVPLMPFGGYKQSGIGRELGQEGMELFMETKSVSLKLN